MTELNWMISWVKLVDLAFYPNKSSGEFGISKKECDGVLLSGDGIGI